MLQYTNRVPVVGDKVYWLDLNGEVDLYKKGVITKISKNKVALIVKWDQDENTEFGCYTNEIVFAE